MVCTKQRRSQAVRQSGLKADGVLGPGLKSGISRFLKIQQMKSHSTVFKGIIPGVFIQLYMQICLFPKVATFGKFSPLIFLYITRYDIYFMKTPRPTHLKIWECLSTPPKG